MNMNISKVEIHNFRCHKETVVELSETNVLIGQNNTGKTAFLEAIDYAIGMAIGMGNRMPSEDDFYAETDRFDPKNSEPIKVILEFREAEDNRFTDNMLYVFDKAIQYDEEQFPDNPIKFIRMCYEFKYDEEIDKYIEERYFVDLSSKKLLRDSRVTRNHLSFFPFFYLTTLRDIEREIKNKSSFFGRIKSSIDFKDKEEDINDLAEQMNDILLSNNTTMDSLKSRLRDIEKNVNISSDSLYLQAFSKRSWELLDGLNIYLRTTNSNLALPISKHGMGTQSIAILLIFQAYLDILLPKIVENEEATPIIGIEEPEAHIHPHSQRAVFQQISNMKGQKIISTHSPFIVDQAGIHDYRIFVLKNGMTRIEKIPKYRKGFKFVCGLPPDAYRTNKFLNPEERLLVERHIQYRNVELFFSSLFILCEGDTEKVFLERIVPHCAGKTPGQLGISIISCEGQTYSPFLKIAHGDAFNLKWLILSDAEAETKIKLKHTVEKCGYNFTQVTDRIHYLPDGMKFEKYCIDFHEDEIKEVIENSFKGEYEKFCNQLINRSKSEEQLIEQFLKTIKVRFAEQLALHIIQQKLKVPDIFKNLIDKAVEEVEKCMKY